MPPDVVSSIIQFGYLAIFILVFSQEIGIPNPIPNEFVLIFSGYLSAKGILSIPLVILTAISADLIGTNVLYFVFYFFGKYILNNKPKWLPLSKKKVDKLRERMELGGLWMIYLGRITPFIRGYTSVITGLLQVKPGTFIPIAILSATTWASVCVLAGKLLGPYWISSVNKKEHFLVLLAIISMTLLIIIARILKKKRAVRNSIRYNEFKFKKLH